MPRLAIVRAVLAASSLLVVCACADNPTVQRAQAHSAEIDRILGPFDSTTKGREFPADPDRSVRTADCRQPVVAEGANLYCD